MGDPLFLNPSLKNFAPRIGVAWAPMADGKMALRAGFGLFHEQLLPNAYITSGVRMPPFSSVFGISCSQTGIDFPDAYVSQTALGPAAPGRALRWTGFSMRCPSPPSINGAPMCNSS